jgi:hypothetical protein
MLLNPRVVRQPGISFFTKEMPFKVSTAELAYSCSPVASVKVSTSKINCHGFKPYFLPVSNSNFATVILSSDVLAIPFGPIHMEMAGMPNFAMIGASAWNREPSPSRLIELMIGLPGI